MSYLISRFFFSLVIFCFAHSAFAAFADINRIYRLKPTLNQFEVCQGGGCAKVSKTALSGTEWQAIASLFSEPAANAEMERGLVSQAIGLLEEVVGQKIGTSGDLAGTFNNEYGQQDCNDEAINTTTYLRLLQQGGYLKFHTIEDMRRRNFFLFGWPHTTAVIREMKTSNEFAVDSWFYDNGAPAAIVPLKQWKDNYQPVDSPIGQSR